MTMYWYALQSHPYKEEQLWLQVQRNGFEAFYPRIRVHPVNPRSRTIRPYFPGYMFVHADLDLIGPSVFQYMPYAKSLVSFGGEPATVPEYLIHTLHQRMAEIEDKGGELFNDLTSGDSVLIQSGPFAGYEALFDVRLPGTDRVRVLLKMLSKRLVPLEMKAGHIQKINIQGNRK
jgi:transcription antitermination factor NusG